MHTDIFLSFPQTTVDILHPLASLEWKECQELPVGMSDATAVWYEDKLYVGGRDIRKLE